MSTRECVGAGLPSPPFETAASATDFSEVFLEAFNDQLLEVQLIEVIQQSLDRGNSVSQIEEMRHCLCRYYLNRGRVKEAEECLLQVLIERVNQHSEVMLMALSDLIRIYKRYAPIYKTDVTAQVEKALSDCTLPPSIHMKLYMLKADLYYWWKDTEEYQRVFHFLAPQLLQFDISLWLDFQLTLVERYKSQGKTTEWEEQRWKVATELQTHCPDNELTFQFLRELLDYAAISVLYRDSAPTRIRYLTQTAHFLQSRCDCFLASVLSDYVRSGRWKSELGATTIFFLSVLTVIRPSTSKEDLETAYSQMALLLLYRNPDPNHIMKLFKLALIYTSSEDIGMKMSEYIQIWERFGFQKEYYRSEELFLASICSCAPSPQFFTQSRLRSYYLT